MQNQPVPRNILDCGAHVEVLTNRGDKVLVDKADASLLIAAVCVSSSNGALYPVMRLRGRVVRIHQIVLPAPAGFEVDHINGNPFDNRRCNLRLASRSQNAANSRLNRANTSGYKGVYWHKTTKRWHARIHVNGRTKSLGYFHTAAAGGAAYDRAALENFGPYARPNSRLCATLTEPAQASRAATAGADPASTSAISSPSAAPNPSSVPSVAPGAETPSVLGASDSGAR